MQASAVRDVAGPSNTQNLHHQVRALPLARTPWLAQQPQNQAMLQIRYMCAGAPGAQGVRARA